MQALRSTQDELVVGLKQEIADKQVQVERIQDRLRVEMVDEIPPIVRPWPTPPVQREYQKLR